ncbi:MAG: MFS transporter [Rhodoferax sp.]|uniref:MFS transporter n=1 Tax=Rhodoferax sp. TaxID=50421 RepID=UPI003263B758
MKTDTEHWQGRAILLLAHVAGMVDLVALPVWVGSALIGQYHLSPPQAGAMVTAYLAAAVLASLVFAPRFHRYAPWRAAPLGYALAFIAFAAMTQTTHVGAMTVLHAVAGLGAGTGLSFVHGTIGRSARPHRLFAIVSIGLGVSGIVFIGVAQSMVTQHGGVALFAMFAALMACATLGTALAFPRPTAVDGSAKPVPREVQPIAAPVWWAIAGLTLMAVTQSMVFSFAERIGTERGFGDRVLVVLVVLGFINLLPPVLAALTERRWPAFSAAAGGVLVQAGLAVALAWGSGFAMYAVATALFVTPMIFTHTFVFGWLSRNDASGRAVALTPAMLMSGAAIGPVVGGVLVAGFGTPSIGLAAVLVCAVSWLCYRRAAHLSPGVVQAASAPAVAH